VRYYENVNANAYILSNLIERAMIEGNALVKNIPSTWTWAALILWDWERTKTDEEEDGVECHGAEKGRGVIL
jgi:hypothetical protein